MNTEWEFLSNQNLMQMGLAKILIFLYKQNKLIQNPVRINPRYVPDNLYD